MPKLTSKPIALHIEECSDDDISLLESVIDIIAQTVDTLYYEELESAFQPNCFINDKSADLLALMKLYQDPVLNFIALNASNIPAYSDSEILYDYSNDSTIEVDVSDLETGYYQIVLEHHLSKQGIIVSNDFHAINKEQKTISLYLFNVGNSFNFLTENVQIGSILKVPTNFN